MKKAVLCVGRSKQLCQNPEVDSAPIRPPFRNAAATWYNPGADRFTIVELSRYTSNPFVIESTHDQPRIKGTYAARGG